MDASKKLYVFLDEIQFLPNITSVIKYLYDHYKIKFVVTGSSSFYLKNHFTESMAGRKLIFELFPLTFQEFLGFKNITKPEISKFSDKAQTKTKFSKEEYAKLYEEYIQYGGFPGVVLEPELSRKEELLKDIFSSYFQKDVASLSDFKDGSKLRDLIYLLMSRIGSKVDISKIATILEISRPTVYNYLEFLDSTYFVQAVSHFSSADKRISGGKKYYLCDSGLSRVLGEVSAGQLFENSVFQNLRPFYDLNFYQRRGGEVDFILDKKMALEVKQTASLADIANMKKRVERLDLKESYIVSRNFVDFEEVIMPWDL